MDTVGMNDPGLSRPPTQKMSSSRQIRVATRVFILLLVLAALALGGYVATGPYRTLSGLQTALVQGNSQSLAELVDFVALRQNLKDQLVARANNQIGSTFKNALVSQIAGGLATTVVDASVDSLVTPEGLNQLFMGASVIAGQLSGNSTGSLQDRFQNGRRSFESLSTFTLSISAISGSDLVLVLTRNGLNWQLTNVRIPTVN